MTTTERSTDFNPFVPALILFGGVALLLIGLLAARPTPTTPPPTINPEAVIAAATAQQTGLVLDPAKVSAGNNTFSSVCAACHGFNAMGISGLGKPLIGSQFVDGLSDDELLAFVIQGRPVTDPLNTTGVPMPARGGNAALSDDDLRNVITYIRSLNGREVAAAPTLDATALAALPTSAPFAPPDINALPVTGANTASSDTGTLFLAGGKSVYERACSSCHGLNGEGQTLNAGPLTGSALIQAKDGIGLLEFLANPSPMANQAFPHPARGGFTDVTDAQLLDVIGYLYTLTAPTAP